LAIVKPDTIVRWHRAGFRLYWRWKSGPCSGRPTVPPELRKLIREMSIANPLWGAPRIHGELLKLGIGIGQTSVAKYVTVLASIKVLKANPRLVHCVAAPSALHHFLLFCIGVITTIPSLKGANTHMVNFGRADVREWRNA
jgi:hypothetical protein